METNICKLKFRRGIEADRKTITPEEGEPIFTTDTHRFCIGDGKTLGGITFPKLYVDDDSNAISGDLVYKDENLWLCTSDTDSIAIGGTQSIKVGNGIETINNKLTVKPASGINVDVSGVSVSIDYIKNSTGITEIDNRINTLSANAIVSPLAPLYNTSTVYAYTAYNAKVPLAINDTGLTPITSVNGVDVYSFKSSDLNIAKNVPDVTRVGINDGCVLNFDNTIKFDYSPTTYIQGYSTSVDGDDITTYTLSTVKVDVPVFSVAGIKPDIVDGSITEAKLSREVQNKLNAGANINFDKIYPVGSIYMSVVSNNPGELFGGTWIQLKDRFLLGAGDTYSNGNIGGEATCTLTIAEIPSHSHYQNCSGGGDNTDNFSVERGPCSGNNKIGEYDTGSTGGGQAHNNMPPYLVVYMWQRTA